MSSVLSPVFKPVNRHILVVPHIRKQEEDHSGVLLPDDYKPQEERYITATVLDISPDCASHFRNLRCSVFSKNKEIVIDGTMLEEIKHRDKKYYVILENYVVGLLKEVGEEDNF